MWFKVDDKLHDHEKIHDVLMEAADPIEGLAALGLWLLAGSWSGDQLADGMVPAHVLRRWGGGHQDDLAALLVSAGLWDQASTDTGRPGYRFHDWLDYNDSRDKIEADRLAARVRQAFYRDKALKAAIDGRDQDRCRYCGTLVNWTDKRGAGGGTYDHVVPIKHGGRNTLTNVVVCCRGCNGRKGELTLEEAGMRLLRPGSLGAPVLDSGDRDDPDAAVSDDVLVTRGSASGRVGSGANYVPGVSPSTPTTAEPTTTSTSSAGQETN